MLKTILLFIITLTVCHSYAAVRTWIGGTSTDWATASNWSPAVVPSGTDDVIIQTGANQPFLSADITIGGFTINSGFIFLGSYNLLITGDAYFNSGTINGSQLTVLSGLAYFGGTTINTDIQVDCDFIYYNGSTFNGLLNVFNHYAMFSSTYSSGGNTFNNQTIITNNGNADIILGNNNPDIFNGSVEFINATPNSKIKIAENSAGNQFNGVVLLDNGTSLPPSSRSITVCDGPSATLVGGSITIKNNGSAGIFFGENGGQTSLPGWNPIESPAFIDGTLLLKNVTFDDLVDIDWMSGTASLVIGPGSTFNDYVTASSPRIFFNGADFIGGGVLIKTGAGNDSSLGGNSFGLFSNTHIINEGTGDILLGTVNPDVFYTYAIIENRTIANIISVAESSAGNIINGNLELDNGVDYAAGSRSIHVARQSGASITFNSGVFPMNNGSNGIYFGENGGQTTLSNTASIGSAGFIDGTLLLSNLTSDIPNINIGFMSGTASLKFGPNSVLNSDITASSPRVFFNGVFFNGTSTINKTGAGDDSSIGGNTFGNISNIHIINSGTGDMLLGTVDPDVFITVHIENRTSDKMIAIAESSSGNVINGWVQLDNGVNYAPGTRTIRVCRQSGASLTVNYWLSPMNNGSAGIFFGENGGQTSFTNTSSLNAPGFIDGTLLLANVTSDIPNLNIGFMSGTASLKFGPNSVFNEDITAVSPRLFFNGADFNSTSNFNKTGAGNDSSLGGNSFGMSGNVTILNTGTGDLILGTVNPDVFQDVIIENRTDANMIALAESSSGNVMNGWVRLDNGVSFVPGTRTIRVCRQSGASLTVNYWLSPMNNGSDGIFFGENGGQTTLTNTAALNAPGFVDGTLLLSNVISNIPNLNLGFMSGTASLKFGPGSEFNGDLTAFSPRIFFNGADFNATTNLNKTGAGNDSSLGGNSFGMSGNVTILNTGTGDLILGTVNPDVFQDVIIENRTDANMIALAESSSGNVMNGWVRLDNGVSFAPGTRTIRVCRQSGSSLTVNYWLSPMNNGSDGIFFGENGGQTTLTNTAALNAPGFVDGTLLLSNVVSNIPNLNLGFMSGTASLKFGPGSEFNGDLTAFSPRIFFNGADFNATTNLNKTGAGNDSSLGGNSFGMSGNVTILNTGTGDLILGTVNPDVFQDVIIENRTDANMIAVAESSSGNVMNGWVRLDNGVSFAPGTRTIRVCRQSGASLTVNSWLSPMNNGSAGIFFGENGGQTLLQNTSALTAPGFVDGTLLLSNVTSNIPGLVIGFMSGNASLKLGPTTVFNQTVNATSPRLFLNGITCNNTSSFTKSGNGDDDSNGGNLYNSVTTISNSGSGNLHLANVSPDIYTDSLSVITSSTGGVDLAYSQNATLRKNLGLNISSLMWNGTNGGTVVFSNGNAQRIGCSTGVMPIFNRLQMNKSANGLTLDCPIRIGIEAIFTSGIINTSTVNFLDFMDNSTNSGANNTSYVNGPVRKTGDDFFVFPVGKGGMYRPAAIGPPAQTTDVFTCNYFNANSDAVYSHTSKVSTINNISKCDYWTIDRTIGTSAVPVYLSWSTGGCNGITNMSDLIVARWDSGLAQWQDHGNGGTMGTTVDGNVESAGAVTSFSPFALASVSALNPLPSDLISFTAEFNSKRSVDVEWITASEINSDYFVIERSANGVDFEYVFTVDAAGNSHEILEYSIEDVNPFEGISYYRLILTDIDGTQKISPIVSVSESESFSTIVYPNPLERGGELMIKTKADPDRILLIDLSGRIVDSVIFQTIYRPLVPAGSYQLSLLKEGASIEILPIIIH